MITKLPLLTSIMLSGACVFGQTEAVLDQNDVSTNLYDNGFFFTDSVSDLPAYEVPKGFGLNSIYTGSFWIGGKDVNGQLKIAAQQYAGSGQDYFGGPICRADANWALAHDYFGQTVWKVSKAEIDYHIANYGNSGYVMPNDIENWPAHGDPALTSTAGMLEFIAPFVDANGNGEYDPENGDYPCIKGDEAVFTIMSDMGGIHTASGGEPVGVELHCMFYQYSSVPELTKSTFVDIEVVNMGSQTLYDATAGFFLDTDLGNFMDDFVGTDTLRNMIYTYNGDAMDEANVMNSGYGNPPPALGLKLLSHNLDHSISYTNSVIYPYTDPASSDQFMNALQGNWADGSDQIDDNSQPSEYFYTGDPNQTGSWAEINTANAPGDRRMVGSTDIGTFVPDLTSTAGNRITFSYALLYGQGSDHLNSVAQLQSLADFAQVFYNNQSSNCFDVSVAGVSELADDLSVTIAPNPNSGSFKILSDESLVNASVTVFDASGKQVGKLVIDSNNQQVDLGLSQGVYYLNINMEGYSIKKKFVVK